MNKNNVGASTNIAQMFMDFLALLIAAVSAVLVIHISLGYGDWGYVMAVLAVFSIVYILSNKEARLYNVTLFFYFDRFFRMITKSWCIAVATTAVLLFAFNAEEEIRSFYFAFIILAYLMVCINMVLSRFIQRMRSDVHAPRVAFVGYYEEYQKFNYFLNKTSIKVEQIGYIVDDDEPHDGVVNVIGKIEDLEEIIRNCKVDQIYFMQKNEDRLSDIQPYVDICTEMGVTVKVVIDSFMHRRTGSYVSSVGTYPVITYHTISLNNYEAMFKRLMDIVVSFVGIVVASPIMLVTAIAIKLESPGPVVFKQTRVGQNGRHFSIYKFRSMYKDAEERKKELMAQNEMQGGVMFKMKDDPRITKVGKFIRKTSIDELPQLFNVLLGTMSLVGTRPPTLDEVEKYKRGQWRRISIKPGITGMWQVSGRNNITDFDEVVELDLYYIDNWNLFMDIKILFKTVGVLFSKDGAY